MRSVPGSAATQNESSDSSLFPTSASGGPVRVEIRRRQACRAGVGGEAERDDGHRHDDQAPAGTPTARTLFEAPLSAALADLLEVW